MQRVDQEQLGNDNGPSLKINRLPAVILEVLNAQHGRINQPCDLGENPFEVGEEGRIVQSPFRSPLIVPLPRMQTVCYSKPVAVNFEVGRFAIVSVRFNSQSIMFGLVVGDFTRVIASRGRRGGGMEVGLNGIDKKTLFWVVCTYYAGNNRIFNAAATRATCGMEGYMSVAIVN